MDYLEFIARVTSHIPDKGQVTLRYYVIYAYAHRGKVRKSQPDKHPFIIVEEESPRVPRRDWAEMTGRGDVTNSLEFGMCPLFLMRIIPFLTNHGEVKGPWITLS